LEPEAKRGTGAQIVGKINGFRTREVFNRRASVPAKVVDEGSPRVGVTGEGRSERYVLWTLRLIPADGGGGEGD